jgi:thiol-disulfide isomerase/thioredoxin
MFRRSLFLVASLAVLGAACTGDGTVVPTPPPLGSSTAATNATTAPLLPAGRFDLPTMTPDQFRQLLTQLKGTPVVVNFWASWCGPCRQEAPGLSAVARRYGGKVQFLGVDLKDTKSAAQVTVRDFGYPYPSVADPGGLDPAIVRILRAAGHDLLRPQRQPREGEPARRRRGRPLQRADPREHPPSHGREARRVELNPSSESRPALSRIPGRTPDRSRCNGFA